MPLEHIVFAAKDRVRVEELASAKANKSFELLFDSFVEPSISGARISVVSARQLLFRIGAVFVDLEVGHETTSDRASLVGQMLDSSHPGHPLAGVPVVLLDRGRSVARTFSNDNGEFQLEFAMKSNLKLSVAVDRNGPVCLPITSLAAKTKPIQRRTKTKSAESAEKTSMTQ